MARDDKLRRGRLRSSKPQAGRRKGKAKSSRLRDKLRQESAKRKAHSGTPSSASDSPLRRQARSRPAARPATPASRKPVRRRSPSVTSGGSIGGAANELQLRIDQIRNEYNRLRSAADLSDIRQAMGRFDARLAELPVELEGLRSRGYVHAGLLEQDIAGQQGQWQRTRPRVASMLRQQASRLRQPLRDVDKKVSGLSLRDAAAVAAAGAAVEAAQRQVDAARRGITGLYDGMESQLYGVESTLNRLDWMLQRFDASPHVRLRETEGPLLAAEAEWQRDGDEGPDGTLFLTDQRLFFEQDEEVAKEKLFGIFATAKEQAQRLLLEVPVHDIEKVAYSEEGGFLGMGKDELLDLVLGPRAEVSRARFHLKDQDSAEWAVWIKRAQTGEIDRDRAEANVEEVAAAEALIFPAQCPSCFAPLPTPPRGATSTVCEFCGTVVYPIATDT